MVESAKETIARLWKMGLSQSAIAGAVGKTRSAIGGAINRMGLTRGKKGRPGTWGHGGVRKIRALPPIGIIMPKHVMPPIPITELGSLSRTDGGPDHCRYIVEGEGARALYCGAPRSNESDNVQYCDEHAARCFNNWPPTGRSYRPKDSTWKEFR